MKAILQAAGIALLMATPYVSADAPYQRTGGPCFNVDVQIDRENHSQVRQNCDINVSRTVQSGRVNRAETYQTGKTNDNKVRQYYYEPTLSRSWTRVE